LVKLDEALKVVSVTKSELSAEEAPAIVEVVTRQQMREWGYTNIAELLNHIVGFYVQDDGILPNVAVRGVSGGLGAESGIIKVMVDGHSVAFRSTAGNWLGPELIPISSIERIEIIRGPASALYGADAFLGVVNIITRSAEKLNGADVSGTVGVPTYNADHPGGDIDGTYGLARGNFEILAGIRLNWDDRSGLALPTTSPAPLIPTYNLGHTVATGNDQFSKVGFLKLSYQAPKVRITLSGRLSSIDRGAEFSSWTQLAHGLDNGRLSFNRVSLYGGSLDLNIRATPTSAVTILFDSQFFGGNPSRDDRIEVNNPQFYLLRRFGYLGVDNNLEIQAKLPKAITLVGGLSFMYDRETPLWSQQVLKSDIGGLPAGSVSGVPRADVDIYNFGAYLQLVWTPIRKEIRRNPESRGRQFTLTVTGGARYDYHSIYEHQGSGRLGIVATYGELSVKVLYGSAFKAPSPMLLYAVPLVPNGDLIGNPALKPQYVNTFEGEIAYRPNKYFSISSDVAYNLISNAAQFTAQGSNEIAQNLGNISALSWETKIDVTYKEWIRAYLTGEYNYTTVSDRQGIAADILGTRNTIYPQGIARLGVLARAPKVPLRLGVQVMYVGPRNASDANSIAAGQQYQLPDYWMLDMSLATLGLELKKGHETTLMVSARNLLDVRGPDPGYWRIDFPLTGRTIWFQIRQDL
jgi:iron complex outermembrane receptor protein